MMTNQNEVSRGQPSGKDVEDFSPFCEGDIDPTLNKRINMLIDSTENYLIYLDDDLIVQLSIVDDSDLAKEYGEIANRVGHLETVSLMLLDVTQLKPFRRLLGEAIARIVGDSNAVQARASLKIAEEFLYARGAERARRWYLFSAATVSSVSGLFLILLWIGRLQVSAVIGVNAFDVVTGSLIGSIGAILAIMTSAKVLKTDASAGPRIHQLEGVVRVGTGIAGALLIALAIKSNIILGFTKASENPLATLYAMCFVAGWSERFVKGLVNRVDNLVSGKPDQSE